MSNETNLHDIIFVTDKYGRRNKTGDIEKLQYDSRKDVYYITYKDGKTYPCRSCDLQIIKKIIDIQNIPYEDNSFDLVIANMMLYHVPDLPRALAEVGRVLKPEGKLYTATF